MNNFLHPDYWVEIPAGEFLAGVPEKLRDIVRAYVREHVGYDKYPPERQAIIESAATKIRQRAKQIYENQRMDIWWKIPPLEFTEEEKNILSGFWRGKRILEIEREIGYSEPKSIYLDRFYIARFPITQTQWTAFSRGTLARQLPSTLDGPAIISEFYEVLRFCQELGGRLPTNFEWDKAAYGTGGWLYPWGNHWDPEAGYFFRGQGASYRVDAYRRGISPYGVWCMAGGLPEITVSLHCNRSWGRRGCHPKESSEGTAWFDHSRLGRNSYLWVGIRPVLDKWPKQQWRGFRAEDTSQFTLPRLVQVPDLPTAIPQSGLLPLNVINVPRIVPLARIETDNVLINNSGGLSGWSFSKNLATLASIEKVYLYDLNTPEPQPEILEDYHSVAVFNLEGTLLASKYDYRMIHILEVETKEAISVLETAQDEHITSLAISPDGFVLASGDSKGIVKLLDVKIGKVELVFEEHTKYISKVVFSPDGVRLASSSHNGTVLLQHIKTNTVTPIPDNHTDAVCDIIFSPNGTLLASASIDRTVRLWDVETAKEVRVFHSSDRNIPRSIAFSPDGSLLAAGCSTGKIQIWEVATGTTFAIIHCDVGWNLEIAFILNGTLLATCEESAIFWGVR
jgi:formylglycine-generating enzyme required for sulfatase activity